MKRQRCGSIDRLDQMRRSWEELYYYVSIEAFHSSPLTKYGAGAKNDY